MSLSSVRMEFRVTLSDIDRGRERSATLALSRHPSETMDHVVLRVLGWCLVDEGDLRFGPELCHGDDADLWSHDPLGKVTTWVECGGADADKLRRVMRHHGGAAVHAVLDDPRRHGELLVELAGWRRPRGPREVALWLVEPALVEALAADEQRRQRWAMTLVGDRLYVDVAGRVLEGDVKRASPPEEQLRP